MTIEQEIISKSSKAHGVLELSAIHIPLDRQRHPSADTVRYIEEELAPSIRSSGFIQPPLVAHYTEPFQHEGKTYHYRLVAGWSRIQAAMLLGLRRIPYCLRENTASHELEEMELAENMFRKSMTWQDEVLAIARIHKAKVSALGKDGERWGEKETGKLLGVQRAKVKEAVLIASYLTSQDKYIWEAKSFTEAKRRVIERKEDEIVKTLSAKAGVDLTLPTTIGPVSAGFDLTTITNELKDQRKPEAIAPQHIDLSSFLIHQDNRAFFDSTPDETFDLIYTDIPYGIDMSNLDYNSDDIERVADAHDVEENLAQMPVFLRNAYRVLKPNTYCLFWYDIAHHEKLIGWGKDAGFTCDVAPIFWAKTHPCRNRAGNVWPTKSVEYCAVFRKGQALLRKPMTKNYFLHDGSAERKLQRNPFSKPFALSKDILEHFVIPGDRVLDCYAGEGSLVRAMVNLGLKPTAVEKEEHHYVRLVEHIKQLYTSIAHGPVTFS